MPHLARNFPSDAALARCRRRKHKCRRAQVPAYEMSPHRRYRMRDKPIVTLSDRRDSATFRELNNELVCCHRPHCGRAMGEHYVANEGKSPKYFVGRKRQVRMNERHVWRGLSSQEVISVIKR